MNILNKLFLAAVALTGLAACGTDHEDTLTNWKWDVAAPADANPEVVEAGWTNVSADFGTLPAYVSVYTIDKTADVKAAKAYIAVADMTKAKFSVSGDIHWNDKAQGNGNDRLYTPTEFYNNNESPTVVINGGLFFESDGFYYSQSSCYHGGAMLCPNQNYYSVNWTDFWYPTIGLFYQDKQGEFHTTWTYYANDGKDYSYAAPRVEDPNKPDTEALNLDGGGSSCMLINGKQTIKPSDGKERSVIDACFIK